MPPSGSPEGAIEGEIKLVKDGRNTMSEEMKYVVRKIKVGEIRLDPCRGQQGRREGLVHALIESIRCVGMLQLPIVRVVPNGRGRGYWLICGGLRFEAFRKLYPSASSITCRVIVCDDVHAREIYLRENFNRSQLLPEQAVTVCQELAEAVGVRVNADTLAPRRTLHAMNAARAEGLRTSADERQDMFNECLSPRAYNARGSGLISTRHAEALCRMTFKEQEAELPVLIKEHAESKVRKVRRYPAQEHERNLVEPMGTTGLSEVSEGQDDHESTAVATVDNQADAKRAPESSAIQVEGTGQREERARWVVPRLKRCGLASERAG
jgi:ParB-like chromosome segregation protein Spo0J